MNFETTSLDQRVRGIIGQDPHALDADEVIRELVSHIEQLEDHNRRLVRALSGHVTDLDKLLEANHGRAN